MPVYPAPRIRISCIVLPFAWGHPRDAGNGENCDIAAYRQFIAYGPSHWAVLAVFVVGVVALVWAGRRQSPRQARLFGRVAGALTAAIYAAGFGYALFPPGLDWSVPLHLSDLAAMVTAYALWSQQAWAVALTYYWGLVLSVQALISPALVGPDFPSWPFLGFWSIHLLVVWGAVYLTWGRGIRPGWRSFRFAVIVTLSWVAVTLAFNSVTGTDYGFLNRKPATPSLLDLMGPWPWYVLIAGSLVVAVWAAITWPWERPSWRRHPTARPPDAASSNHE
jgi:hypothetical integral membrane protein (TIGR02206 family)